MDQKRAQTLQALEAFIQSQKTLLETTYSDIERLRGARAAAIADPVSFLNNLHANLGTPAFRLSALPDFQVVIPKGVDWSVFEGYDPAPLQKFTLDAQRSFVARNEPHSIQKSPLSDLQNLVKSARRSIIDPCLAAFSQYMADLGEDDESEEEMDEEEIRREREREKIRLMKQRKIRTCGLKLPGLRMEGGSTAVFVRHDVEDESMDVDISIDHDGSSDQNANHILESPSQQQLEELSDSNSHHRPSRTRRPTKKKMHASAELSPISRSRKKSRIGAPPNSNPPPPPPPPPPKSRATPLNDKDKSQETGKPKPETYKQAWSVSEQHLLEQLLEQIPEGEKYRWQKISRAMNGRRTPRQVASRVQKYFEKLKKYGIDTS